MKKILGEYSQILGYTFTGLIFGLSFFLLFLNFYHYKEVNYTVEEPTYLKSLKSRVDHNISQVKHNASLHDVNYYHGSESGYELLSIQSRLMLCSSSFEDKKMENMLNKDIYTASDIYDLEALYHQKIINDCVVKQLYGLTFSNQDNSRFQSSSVRVIAPFIKLQADSFIRRTKYLSSNIKNNSSYFFTNQDAKENIFDVLKESYYEILDSYEDVSEFLLEISKWYLSIMEGGGA